MFYEKPSFPLRLIPSWKRKNGLITNDPTAANVFLYLVFDTLNGQSIVKPFENVILNREKCYIFVNRVNYHIK